MSDVRDAPTSQAIERSTNANCQTFYNSLHRARALFVAGLKDLKNPGYLIMDFTQGDGAIMNKMADEKLSEHDIGCFVRERLVLGLEKEKVAEFTREMKRKLANSEATLFESQLYNDGLFDWHDMKLSVADPKRNPTVAYRVRIGGKVYIGFTQLILVHK